MIPRSPTRAPRQSPPVAAGRGSESPRGRLSTPPADTFLRHLTGWTSPAAGEAATGSRRAIAPKGQTSPRRAAPSAVSSVSPESRAQRFVERCVSDCIQLRRNGDCDRAILRAQDVLNEVELTHEQAGLLHLQLGKAHQQLGRFARASASFRHAERLFAACGQPRRGDVGFYSALVAMLWLQSGESGAPSRCEAEDACVAATSRLDAERTAHNAPPRRRAAVANKQGLLFALRGDEVQALGRYTEALGLYGLLGDLGGQAYSYHRMGLAYRALGKLSEAGDTIERAVALYMRCGPSERLRLVQAQQLVAELREVPR